MSHSSPNNESADSNSSDIRNRLTSQPDITNPRNARENGSDADKNETDENSGIASGELYNSQYPIKIYNIEIPFNLVLSIVLLSIIGVIYSFLQIVLHSLAS